MQIGRFLVQVPDVLGLIALDLGDAVRAARGPTGPPMGVFCVPPIGAGVWVEFEQGDPDYPIWVGLLLGRGGRRARAGAAPGLPVVAEHRAADRRAEHAS